MLRQHASQELSHAMEVTPSKLITWGGDPTVEGEDEMLAGFKDYA